MVYSLLFLAYTCRIYVKNISTCVDVYMQVYCHLSIIIGNCFVSTTFIHPAVSS